MTDKHTLVEPTPIWACKIGITGTAELPPGCDAPMRKAIEDAFSAIVGRDCDFNFSGWSAKLDDGERAVVENRLPTEEEYQAWKLRESAPDMATRITALEAREAELVEAMDSVMVGGNHLALLIGTDHPPFTTEPFAALEHYGAGDTYEIWCCWRSIMLARATLAKHQEGDGNE